MRWLSEFVDRHKKSIIITFVAVSLVGVLLFKERLSMRQWISIFAIAAALVLLNL